MGSRILCTWADGCRWVYIIKGWMSLDLSGTNYDFSRIPGLDVWQSSIAVCTPLITCLFPVVDVFGSFGVGVWRRPAVIAIWTAWISSVLILKAWNRSTNIHLSNEVERTPSSIRLSHFTSNTHPLYLIRSDDPPMKSSWWDQLESAVTYIEESLDLYRVTTAVFALDPAHR